MNLLRPHIAAALIATIFCQCICAAEFPLPLTAHPPTTDETGWHDLFAEDLSDANFAPDSWAFEDGVLSKAGKGFIWTKKSYGDFILDLEFKIQQGGNSGVFLRAGDTAQWLHTAIEIDINDSYGDHPRYAGLCGAVYDCVVPTTNAVKPPGEWNHLTITCCRNKIYVILNDKPIVDMDLDRWTTARQNPDGTRNKFKRAYKEMPRIGPIGFQDHDDQVWFRNVRIKELQIP